MMLFGAQEVLAACEYGIRNHWNTGFEAYINKITNDTDSVVNGWEVSWEYTRGDEFSNGWNADFSGDNPYTATSLSWNGTIQPGNAVEFGFQGTIGTADAQPEMPGVRACK